MISWAYLKDRKVIECLGEKALELLQGLVTQDIVSLKTQNLRGGFSVLLTPKGFFQSEFFLFFHETGVFLECHEAHFDFLFALLQKYSVLHDVHVRPLNHKYAVCCALGPNVHEICKTLRNTDQDLFYVEDPRHPLLGVRALVPYRDWHVPPHPLFHPCEGSIYHQKRIEAGVPEGAFDLVVDRSMILEYGYQHLNAVSWNKGCYLGQELMARTFHRGQLRKTLYFLHQHQTPSSGQEFPICGTTLFMGKAKVGTMGGNLSDMGLASLYPHLVESDSFLNFETEEGHFLFSAQVRCLYPLSDG
jgi:tRNA-modifying protein YgfZ